MAQDRIPSEHPAAAAGGLYHLEDGRRRIATAYAVGIPTTSILGNVSRGRYMVAKFVTIPVPSVRRCWPPYPKAALGCAQRGRTVGPRTSHRTLGRATNPSSLPAVEGVLSVSAVISAMAVTSSRPEVVWLEMASTSPDASVTARISLSEGTDHPMVQS